YIPHEHGRATKNSSVDVPNVIPSWLSCAATAGWEKLQKYYPTSDGEVYLISTILDPRCKLEFFKISHWKREWTDRAKKCITEVWKKEYKPQTKAGNEANNPANPGSSVFANMYASRSTSSRIKSDDELVRYLWEKVVSPELTENDNGRVNGCLGWWKIHEAEFPNLS
ncbi:unnamed protein product, partial [Allacma fusca]